MNGNTESIETEKSVRKKHESVRSSTGKNVPGMQTQVKESEPKTGPEKFTTQPHSQLQRPAPNVNTLGMVEDMKPVLLPGDLLSQYESYIEELSAMATFKHTILKFISAFHTALTKMETLQKTILENTSTLTAMNTSQQREIKALKLLLLPKTRLWKG